MVEFALVAPIFFASMIGTIDGGLLMLTVNAANHSTGVGMVTLSEEPQAPTSDTDTLTAIKASGLGATGLAHLDEIDFCKLNGSNLSNTGQCDSYTPNGAGWNTTSSAYPPATRQVDSTGANLDYVGIYVKYHFSYFVLEGGHSLKIDLVASKLFRLEPQG